MAIKKMSYLELAPKVRETSGAVALSDLRRTLNVPGVSAEQRTEIEARIQRVSAWIRGTLPVDKPVAQVTDGQHHTVVVSEKVSVKDDIG